MEPPLNPAGAFVPEDGLDPQRRAALIVSLEEAPNRLREAIAGLSEGQLDCRYRDWTIRQIVHHLADSHLNSYCRFKWALTEEQPTIKAYDEGRWAALEDAKGGAIGPSLACFEGLHARWVQLLRSMTEAQFARCFLHPEGGRLVSLDEALGYYEWHARHHTAQINWVRGQQGWSGGHDP